MHNNTESSYASTLKVAIDCKLVLVNSIAKAAD